MMPSSRGTAPDDVAIEALFRDVLLGIEHGPSTRLEIMWVEFERALAEHFEHEERTVLADLLAARPREARLILEEHRYLRGRLAQLRTRLPNLPLEIARTFLDELQAHGHHEERVLRRWADSSAPPSPSKSPV